MTSSDRNGSRSSESRFSIRFVMSGSLRLIFKSKRTDGRDGRAVEGVGGGGGGGGGGGWRWSMKAARTIRGPLTTALPRAAAVAKLANCLPNIVWQTKQN